MSGTLQMRAPEKCANENCASSGIPKSHRGAKNKFFSKSKVGFMVFLCFSSFWYFGLKPKKKKKYYAYIVYCSAFKNTKLLSQSPKISNKL